MTSDEDVIEHRLTLFRGPPVIRCYRQGEVLNEAAQAAIPGIVAESGRRLSDLHWYTRCLNEHIARGVNAEDGVISHFSEARFKSQALLDEVPLSQGMVYADLNLIRAAMAIGVTCRRSAAGARDGWRRGLLWRHCRFVSY